MTPSPFSTPLRAERVLLSKDYSAVGLKSAKKRKIAVKNSRHNGGWAGSGVPALRSFAASPVSLR